MVYADRVQRSADCYYAAPDFRLWHFEDAPPKLHTALARYRNAIAGAITR